jgi:hypothetical protein
VTQLDSLVTGIDTLVQRIISPEYQAEAQAQWEAQGGGLAYTVGSHSPLAEVCGHGVSGYGGYAERRELLRLLGVQVRMYATTSDYARRDGKRWEFAITVADGITSRSACS